MKPTLTTWLRRWAQCKLVKCPFFEVKRAYDQLAVQGAPMEWNALVAHHLAGGTLVSLVDGITYAKQRGVKMSHSCACAVDLYAKAKYQLCLKDWLRPVIDSGIDDISKAPL